jgi:hypothetical protein
MPRHRIRLSPNAGLAHEERLHRRRHGCLDVLPIVVPHEWLADERLVDLAHRARFAFADRAGSELRRPSTGGVGSGTLGITLPRPPSDAIAPVRRRSLGAPADEEGGGEQQSEEHGEASDNATCDFAFV